MQADLCITLDNVKQTARLIRHHIVQTPVVNWTGPEIESMLPAGTTVAAKLEVFQRSGTFKARATVAHILRLNSRQKQQGVTAMSSGNHAIATAWASAACGIHAKVVMQASANPARVALARAYGAEVLIAEDGATGFAMARQIEENEGRYFIHPFESPETALATATIGVELKQQLSEIDVLIIAVGGGGLAGGLSAICKLLYPDCYIIGVGPRGGSCMYESFRSGRPEQIEKPNTIADSLAPPMTLPYPYQLCKQNIDRLMLVSDREIAAAMRLVFRGLKLAVEPACAVTTAAMVKVAHEFPGARIAVLLCGSNIDIESYNACSELGTGE